MSDETATEQILAGIAQIQRDADGPGPAADAIDRGRQAIALLRRWRAGTLTAVGGIRGFEDDVEVLLRACAEGDAP